MPRPRVLLVDDDPLLRDAYVRMLSGTCDVTVAASTAAALALVEHSTFDVVFCDVRMPVADGFELQGQLESRFPALSGRLVFLTGDLGDARLRASVAAGKARALEKPVRIAQLREVIAAVIDAATSPA